MNNTKKIVQPAWHQPSANAAPVLKLYNSLTRKKDPFVPIQNKRISWYACGPTVYNHAHMGHARNYVCSDLSRRILQDYFGYDILFVQNVTDIDDKIIVAARQQHLFKQRFVQAYPSVTADLVASAEQCLGEYVASNLPHFSGDLRSALPLYLDSLDLVALALENPKLPMHVKAARTAHRAIILASDHVAGLLPESVAGQLPESVAAQLPQSVADFLSLVEDVVVPSLDRRYGATVTDPDVFKALPAYWENRFNVDMQRLNVLEPSVTTRVLEFVPEIVDFVSQIIENGFAYATADGSVYFDTVAFETHPDHDYAKLQPWNKGSLDLINEGEGSLSSSSGKKNLADFALWKSSKPGEPSWESQWGKGRPGWHIECSVMASNILGDNIDIHSGGVDLCFPHHDNELAQSEAFFQNKQWINYFLHNGHLHIQGQKMSKSLKNFITIEEALQTYTPRQLRLVFAFGNWEKPLDFKDSLVNEVKAYESSLSKFFITVRALKTDQAEHLGAAAQVSKKLGDSEKQLLKDLAVAQADVHLAFCDNLSCPAALRAISDLVSKTNTYLQSTVSGQNELRIEPLIAITTWIVKILNILGFETRPDRLGWIDGKKLEDGASAEEVAMPYVKSLSKFRDSVRDLAINKAEAGDFLQASDALRSELFKLGISLDDRPNGGALVKFLNEQERQELMTQQNQKEQQAREKAEKKRKQAEENSRKEQERQEKMKIKPEDLFQDKNLYSEWDEQGLPTKTAAGEEVTKSMRKKLMKQYQAQEKLHLEYLKSG